MAGMIELEQDHKDAIVGLPHAAWTVSALLLEKHELTREDIDRAYQAVLEVRAQANLLKGYLQSLIADPA